MGAEAKIMTAFLFLAKHTTDFKINVTNICQEADISRRSFYNYFIDIDDLIEKIYKMHIYDAYFEDQNRTLCDMTCKMLENVKNNANFYRYAFKKQAHPSLKQYITQMGTEIILELIQPEMRTPTLELYANMASFTTYSLTKEWVNYGMGYSPEFLAEFMTDIMPNKIRHAISSSWL